MPAPATTNAAVHDLLAAAESAERGADFALECKNGPASKHLIEKARRLREDAHTVDPRHECAAWANDASS